MTDGTVDEGTRYACPKCGTEVARKALLCPNCRELLTGDNAPIPVRPKPKAKPATPPTRAAAKGRLGDIAPLGTDLEEGNVGVPLGRPVDEKASLFKNTLDRIEGSWASTGRIQGQRTKIIVAGVFAAIGLILLFRMLVLHPWAPLHSLVTSSPKPASVLSSEGQTAGGSPSSVRDAGSAPSHSSVLPSALAPSNGSPGAGNPGAPQPGKPVSPEERKRADTILAAADQLERLSQFLVPTAGAAVRPRNPEGPEAVLPPIPKDQAIGPNATPEEKQRFAALMIRREETANQVAHYIVSARQMGITGEQARSAAVRLRQDARSILGETQGGASSTGSSGSEHWAAPGSPLSQTQLEQIIRVLLGTDDGGKVVRLLGQ